MIFEGVEHNPSVCSFFFKNRPGILATISKANFYSLDSVERKSIGTHISVSFPEYALILVVHLQDSLTMKRMTSFLLLYPQNQGIFWKGDRNMGSN